MQLSLVGFHGNACIVAPKILALKFFSHVWLPGSNSTKKISLLDQKISNLNRPDSQKILTKQTQDQILNFEGHLKDAKRLNAAVSKLRQSP